MVPVSKEATWAVGRRAVDTGAPSLRGVLFKIAFVLSWKRKKHLTGLAPFTDPAV